MSRSMTGYLVLMSNGPIAWKSGRQLSIALATSAAETVALMKVCVVTKHLRQMLFDLICPQEEQSTTYVDNKIALVVSDGKEIMHLTAKHVTVQSHYVTD